MLNICPGEINFLTLSFTSFHYFHIQPEVSAMQIMQCSSSVINYPSFSRKSQIVTGTACPCTGIWTDKIMLDETKYQKKPSGKLCTVYVACTGDPDWNSKISP